MAITVKDLVGRLGKKARRGSKPRCHLLTHGSNDEVAARLTALGAPFATVSPVDRWMPQGFVDTTECQLHLRSRVLDSSLCDELESWWLAPASVKGMTPNIDIASTCTIDGRSGLLIVEAKAHEAELTNEEGGRKLDPKTPDRNASHEKIGAAIAEACLGLQAATGLNFQISRDRCYQMSNRFTWSWKLAAAGVPVILVYLGFLDASEMPVPLRDHEDWERLVRRHSSSLFPSDVWGHPMSINGHTLVPLIKSMRVPLSG